MHTSMTSPVLEDGLAQTWWEGKSFLLYRGEPNKIGLTTLLI
ncbi:MAG: hypothetical protein ACQZ3N_09775 [cyanobacterium endosymbiont of Rhopalodia yunnanensis]